MFVRGTDQGTGRMELETSYTPREQAILRILNELTPRFQKFASESLTDAETQAMTSLVRCGFAKTKLTYCVHNDSTDYYMSLPFILSGNFEGNDNPYLTYWRGPLGTPLMDFIAALCPPDWSGSKPLVSNPAHAAIVPADGVNIANPENHWDLAITDNGRQWQSDSSSDCLILFESRKLNAAAVIIKDGGGERIRPGTAAPTNEQGGKQETTPEAAVNPWKQAREKNTKITIADQMVLLFKQDDSIVDRKNLSGAVAEILGCSDKAVRHRDNATWKIYRTEQARRKTIRQELKGKRWTDSEQNDGDD